MSPNPRLSIIIPVLNEAHLIDTCLAMLAGAMGDDSELIVVDGGSDDPTATLATRHPVQLIVAPRGRASQMNAGARASRGDHLLFLHADTRLPAHAGSLIVDALAGDRIWGHFKIALTGRSAWLQVVAWCMNTRSRLTGIATGDQALFMTRRAFETAGGFPAQPLMEDIEMSRRLKRLSPPAYLHARVVSSGRRWEQHGVWRTIVSMWRLRLRYWLGIDSHTLAREYRDVR